MSRYNWTSPVSTVENGEILLRGYPIQEIMESLSYSDATFLIIRGEVPTAQQSEVFRTCLNSILDYAMGPAPFAGRVVASANPQLGPAMAAGILAQGKYAVSPQDMGEFLEEALVILQEEAGNFEEAATRIVLQKRALKQRIPGLGHPSALGTDPRATRIQQVLKENNLWNDAAKLVDAVQIAWEQVTGKALVVNVDGMLAVALFEIGFKPVEMGGAAAISMLPGIIANTVHEIYNGVPIRQIPEIEYTGEPRRSLHAKEVL